MKIFKIKAPGSNIADDETSCFDPKIDIIYSDFENDKSVFDTEWHRKKYGFLLSEPEYSLHSAHRMVWERFLETSDDWCCVIEDRTNITWDLQLIKQNISELDNGWEIFFPYSKINKSADSQIRLSSSNLLNPNIREMREMDPFYLGFLWDSHIYFISRKGAERLYSNNLIRQRVEDEFWFQTQHNQMQTKFENVSWFDVHDQTPFLPSERLQNIHQAVINYNTWEPESLMSIRQILNYLSVIAETLEIDLILQGGTHLGYIRHGGIMPWDDDVDLGIEESDLDGFLEKINTHEALAYKIFIEPHTNVPYYKIWLNAGHKIEGHGYNFPFVDLWIYTQSGNDLIFKNGIVCPNSALKPFLPITFEGSVFKIPFNSIECLDSRYVDWKTNIRIYSWSHQAEKNNLLPLTTKITVDKNGRLVNKCKL